MKQRSWLFGLVSAVAVGGLVGFTSPARADVVAPPESGECPEGTKGYSSHGLEPAGCSPLTCTSDADCDGGLSCVELSYCSYYDKTCSGVSDCGNNQECTAEKVCATPPEESGGDSSGDGDGGGGCSLQPGGAATGAGALLLLVLGGIGGARRRRRVSR